MTTNPHKAYREHMNMMLEAMGYKGPTQQLNAEQLRDLVEDQKIRFLQTLQVALDTEQKAKQSGLIKHG